MAQIVSLAQIKDVCRDIDFAPLIEQGFGAYSAGRVVVPPVGELSFVQPPGDTHIKYGYIAGDDWFVIKIASGFYQNPAIGLPSNSGLMLVFSQTTGILQTILLDEGYLTDVRTAVAGAIAARYLAPREVTSIGVLGTGIQARLQVLELRSVTPCRRLLAWGRNPEHLAAYCTEMAGQGFSVTATQDPAAVAGGCNLIVTATPATVPLLTADMIRPGTHITAMGSDTEHKQELDPSIVARADLVVADSIAQCRVRGEISRALAQGLVQEERIVELGSIINGERTGRIAESQISVADLTGVAVQDIQVAAAVCRALEAKRQGGEGR